VAEQFNEAFTKLWEDKYHVSVAYTDMIRRVSEKYGPLSIEMKSALHNIDDILQRCLTDIRSKEMTKGVKMNVLVLSDYGITDLDMTTDINISNYINMDDVQYLIYSSGYASIVPIALQHAEIIETLSDIKGIDVYLTKRVQEPPIKGADKIPDSLRYGKGDWTQDILIVAKPSFQITTNPHEKIIPVSNLNDDELKGGQGYNPNHDEKFYPYIDKRTLRNKALNDSIDDFKRYDKFKWDMRTQAFAMGPDFKKNFKLYDPIETVDFYQLICFLLQIPPEEHEGEWEHIAPMLTISSAMPSVLSSNCISIFLLFIPMLLQLF